MSNRCADILLQRQPGLQLFVWTVAADETDDEASMQEHAAKHHPDCDFIGVDFFHVDINGNPTTKRRFV